MAMPSASAPALHLRRDGQVLTATIASVPGTDVAGYWAVLTQPLQALVLQCPT
jgi:hypothetical protein